MLHRIRFLFALLIALSLVVVYTGCERTQGTYNGNQTPHVAFVNYPVDSTQFNYAPVVYWKGWDDDGLLTAFQYRDDTTAVTMDYFKNRSAAEFQNYTRTLSDSAWIRTDSTFATVFLLTSPGDTSEHIFMVRSIDDRGGISDVAVRFFQRTNQPPNPPELKWALDTTDYAVNKTITDTLFWGDTLSGFYPGVQILWKGTDPDSRALYTIPLQFSYLLINTDTQDTVPFRYYDEDSVLIRNKNWSNWSTESQAIFWGQSTGNYFFQLRVRDDGYTPSTTIATLRFYAIRPTFEKQLLIVNGNRPLSGADALQGGRPDQEIMDFYRREVPEALQAAQNMYGTELIPNITVDYFDDYANNSSIPFALINQYRWIWVINDDNIPAPTAVGAVLKKEKVMKDYMNVGGQVMLSGRRFFRGNYSSGSGGIVTGGDENLVMFDTYFNIPWIYSNTFVLAESLAVDFSGANTTNPMLSNLKVDSAVVCGLSWNGSHHFCNLPQIDYFSRTSVSGSSYSETVFNYNSSTAHDTADAFNEDCGIQENYIVGRDTVVLTTPTRAFLLVQNNHTRILDVDRIYNVTKGCYGEFMWVDRGGPSGAWRIVASTLSQYGAWSDDDVLQVDYRFIPTSPNMDQPVAMNFTAMEGSASYDPDSRSIIFVAKALFRSSLFTFPLSFMDNTPGQDGIKPLTKVIAYQAFYFNQPNVIQYGGRIN